MMQATDAYRLVGLLAATGHGWTDVHVEVYADEFAAEMVDPAAAEAAVRHVIRTWDRPVRVPIATVLAQYRIEVDRRALGAPRAISTGRVVPFSEGINVAWRAYVAEAHRLGKQPDRERFATFAEHLGTFDD